jgi:Domain of Unknown Function (DUF1080)
MLINLSKKVSFLFVLVTIFLMNSMYGQNKNLPALKHPDTSTEGWKNLFNNTLSDAIYPAGVWSNIEGIITATKDEALWSDKEYDNFILDLEFKNADSTNSGVIVHASDIKNWIPHSVEIQNSR